MLDAVASCQDEQTTITRLARKVLDSAQVLGLKIASAESCTGGQLASALTSVEGLSHHFECAFVTYSDQSKTALLGVPATLIELEGSVSGPVARLMAWGAATRSGADIAVAITGFAGPGAANEEPGLVHIALANQEGCLEHSRYQFPSNERKAVRDCATAQALEMLAAHLEVVREEVTGIEKGA